MTRARAAELLGKVLQNIDSTEPEIDKNTGWDCYSAANRAMVQEVRHAIIDGEIEDPMPIAPPLIAPVVARDFAAVSYRAEDHPGSVRHLADKGFPACLRGDTALCGPREIHFLPTNCNRIHALGVVCGLAAGHSGPCSHE